MRRKRRGGPSKRNSAFNVGRVLPSKGRPRETFKKRVEKISLGNCVGERSGKEKRVGKREKHQWFSRLNGSWKDS